jgi:RNA-splicing ligase RtcB
VVLLNKIKNSIIYSDTIDEAAIEQIKELCKIYRNEKIRIMPDYHAGKGCVIGTTIELLEKVTPNLVGVDIGCGVLAINLGKDKIDLKALDNQIKTSIPNGFNIHQEPLKYDIVNYFKEFEINNIEGSFDKERALCSLGTLGGGNHFIEIDKDFQGDFWLLIHSGSRHLGVEICNFYQNLAISNVDIERKYVKEHLIRLIKEKLGAEEELSEILKRLNANPCPEALAYLNGVEEKDYFDDMRIVQRYASLNRWLIAEQIGQFLNKRILFKSGKYIETIHNYIDFKKDNDFRRHKILRKGAVSAEKGEKLIIPMNMRDGVLLCEGKGNEDWNCSAPHGAGRLMSRKEAKTALTVEDFKEDMQGIYSSTVNESTIDEAPAAYKRMEDIMELIKPTVDILDVWKPIYNFKASN